MIFVLVSRNVDFICRLLKPAYVFLGLSITGLLVFQGCALLFGYKVHAHGILSEEFSDQIAKTPHRIALYVPENTSFIQSKDRGSRLSDPQTYYIGEAFVPMLIEAFQAAFEEFVLMEADPTIDAMSRYGIPYLAVVELKGFDNRKRMGDQGIDIDTETLLFDGELGLVARFETRGSSEAKRVFAKKGGPEINLNHAIEANLRSVVTYLQDHLSMRERGEGNNSP